MRAGIYIRVSTQEQAEEGYSVGAQTDRLRAYCKAKGWNVQQIYTDPGFSGSNTDRPALNQMISDVQGDKLDIILVYKLDRLSRSQKDTLFLIEDVFLKNNVEFVSMNENFDTSTAFGRAMIGILSVFAQLEREQIKERTSMGKAERAKEGLFHGGGFAPIGYDYSNGELIINEYEAMQIREIYSLFLEGNSINGIRNIMLGKYTNKHGSWHSVSSVRVVLTAPLYTGMIRHKGNTYQGKHEPIIDKETWDRAQKLYQDQRTGHKKMAFKASYLLTGLLKCGNCGARYFAKGAYIGREKEYRAYYSCYSRAKVHRNMIKDPACKNKNYHTAVLDKIVSDEILKLAYNNAGLDKLIRAPKEKDNSKVITTRIKELDKQISRVLDLYQVGDIQMDSISARLDSLNKEKAALSEKLQVKNKPSITRDKALSLLSTAKAVLRKGTLEQQRNLVKGLIDFIEIKNEEILIHWSFI